MMFDVYRQVNNLNEIQEDFERNAIVTFQLHCMQYHSKHGNLHIQSFKGK